MDFFRKVNELMDKGYKMSDAHCEKCRTPVMCDPTLTRLFCVTCGEYTELNLASTTNSNQDEDNQQEVKNEELAPPPKPRKTDDYSKKIGEKLLMGYTMLEQACDTCYVPLMRSKKKEVSCVGCGRIFSQAAAPPPPAPSSTTQETKKPEPAQKVTAAPQRAEPSIKKSTHIEADRNVEDFDKSMRDICDLLAHHYKKVVAAEITRAEGHSPFLSELLEKDLPNLVRLRNGLDEVPAVNNE
eukprot:TRINITY_DN2137_c0_g1_i17.p1 TRINITY_DN2137_c0_g1~~TRINITY_DN2137_c0_g1_i17.p1  ORF type:complete len:241 (-),score=32.23 TRINITY_DN2137_c0_g1_i17:755-1477(-)